MAVLDDWGNGVLEYWSIGRLGNLVYVYSQLHCSNFLQNRNFTLNPGPDLACNAEAVLPGLINNIDIAIFAEEVAPGRAGQALGTLVHLLER